MLTETISASEVVKILYRELGDVRQWHSFLADNRRGRQEIYGIQLLPIARLTQIKMRGEARPIYSVQSVWKFVERVKDALPKSELKEAEYIIPIALEIDETIHWKLNCYRGTTLISKRKNTICFRGFSNRVKDYPKQIH